MAPSKPPNRPGQYDVGYGKPRVKDQFKLVQSGNLGGRRGQPPQNEIFMWEATRLVKVKRGDTVEMLSRHVGVAADHSSLNFDRATRRVEHTTELRDDPACCALDDPPAMRGDRRIDQIAAQPPQPSRLYLATSGTKDRSGRAHPPRQRRRSTSSLRSRARVRRPPKASMNA
jgi:hypothetical protein